MAQSVRDRFDEIVDHGGFDDLPPFEDDGDGGGGGRFPSWATHVMCFLLGGITWGAFLLGPIAYPVIGLLGVVALVCIAVRKRWR